LWKKGGKLPFVLSFYLSIQEKGIEGFKYVIQRREENSRIYKSFLPQTDNFLIDTISPSKTISRSSELPAYLTKNKIYNSCFILPLVLALNLSFIYT
jgi:uncharacterized Rmd1/YagE family protein